MLPASMSRWSCNAFKSNVNLKAFILGRSWNLNPRATEVLSCNCILPNRVISKLDIHISVHHDIIYENDQQDATV